MRKIVAILFSCALLTSAQGPRRAPGFALPDTKYLANQPGGRFHDLADYRGKVLVLEFMKTTCPHCATFAGILSQLAQRYGDKVAVLAVTNLNTDSPQAVAEYVAAQRLPYPVVMDQGQMMFSYILKPQGADVPHVYVIDTNGFIRADYVYDLSTRDIFEGKGLFVEIDKVLDKK
jgi:thiol-disulfide isomerase/thioredoxin